MTNQMQHIKKITVFKVVFKGFVVLDLTVLLIDIFPFEKMNTILRFRNYYLNKPLTKCQFNSIEGGLFHLKMCQFNC